MQKLSIDQSVFHPTYIKHAHPFTAFYNLLISFWVYGQWYNGSKKRNCWVLI